MAADYTKYVIYKGSFPDVDVSGNGYINKDNVGTIDSVEYKLKIDVAKASTPYAASSQSIGFDLGGLIKEIVIEGHRVDTVENLKTFLNFFKGVEGEATPTGLISSKQLLDGIKFHNPFYDSSANTHDITVIITGFDSNYEKAAPSQVNYTMTLMESQTF